MELMFSDPWVQHCGIFPSELPLIWSAPSSKMSTNGTLGSSALEISLSDVSAEAFTVTLQFMYTGKLEMGDET